jgi:demethylmenaquinone methyltransferase/2-methoxy-6-polyprenyl-1,4-benzoquinol methylase
MGDEHASYIRSMFARVAARYDLLNRLMSFGQDRRWRREAVGSIQYRNPNLFLDLGTGTGDLALEVLERFPEARVIAVDFTAAMLNVARTRSDEDRVSWVIADAHNLPFKSLSFHCTLSAFLIRNVPEVDLVLKEQYRALVPKGEIAILDTTPPRGGWLHPFIRFYLQHVIPRLGKWFAGDQAAYTYLQTSTRHFLDAETLASRIRSCGFHLLQFRKRMGGTIAIHWAMKPASHQNNRVIPA